MKRIDCLRALAPHVTDEDLIVVSLGGTGLEWNAVRPGDNNLFLLAMGCNTPVALGLALAAKHRRVILLETDGALLLTLGALATLGNEAPPNLRVFVFDNEGYERVKHNISATKGRTDLSVVAQGCGIHQAIKVESDQDFATALNAAMAGDNLSFIVAKVESGMADVSPRASDGLENMYRFVRNVERLDGQSILPAYRDRLD